jgi:peptidyl-prolyl cis-trans isomerase D
MMQWIHDRAKGVAFWVILVPLALVFVVWGVHGIADFSPPQGEGLKVNGESVPAQRLTEAYQRQIAQLSQAYEGEVPAEVTKEVQDAVVNAFVQRALVNARTVDAGYAVSDAQVAESIMSIPVFQVGGKFSRDAYDAALRAQNINVAAFEAEQRESLLLDQVQAALGRSAFLTPKEIDEVFALRGEERELSWVVLPLAGFARTVAPDEATLEAWLKSHEADFRTPESVALQYLELRLDDIAAKVVVTDESLRAYYETVKARYATSERRRARHILIEAGSDAAAAKQKAEGLLAQVKGGADFAALATANSADGGSAPMGGDLGMQEKDFFVGPFADAVWAMKPGEVQLVQTDFGYHVVRLEEVDAGSGRSFDSVRAELVSEFQRSEAEKAFGEAQEALETAAFENAGSLEPVARKVGLPLQSVESFTRAVGGGVLPADKKLVDAVFAKSVIEGANSRAVDLGNGRIVVARVTRYRAPQAQPLAAVRDRVIAAVRDAQGREQATAAAQAALKALADGKPLAAATAGIKDAKAEAARWVNRKAEGVAPELLKAAFTGPRPTAPVRGTVTLANGDQVVWQVTSARPGPLPTGDTAMIEARQLMRQTSGRDLAGYVSAMRAKADVKVAPTLFK